MFEIIAPAVKQPTPPQVHIYWEEAQSNWIVWDGKRAMRLRQEGTLLESYLTPKEVRKEWEPKLIVTPEESK